MKQKITLACILRTVAIFTLLSPVVNTRAQTPTLTAATPPVDVPVREVVLFSSGVGYFQHEGQVNGDGQALLRFKTAQMNDILKSLILQDLDGGHVGVVTYPSQDPLAKTLASFQVDISDNPGLGELLDKLRGARVSFPGATGPATGTILGVEKRQVPGAKPGDTPLEKSFLNLVTDRGLMSLELDSVNAIKLDDPGLQDELNRALAAVAGARDQDKKPVEIHFNGTGERHVRLGYVVETPVWKASYRLVLPDDKALAADKNAKGTLQGWAMVDNQTDNDWNNVRLSLVSGRPISFQENLYQPLYVPRPTVVPEQYASLRPQEYAGGEGAMKDEWSTTTASAATQAAAPAPMLRRTRSSAEKEAIPGLPTAPPLAENIGESILPIADTAKVGELFQYTVGNVSLARQSSAMIPIINDPIAVEKLSIYNEGVLVAHPLNGVRLHNDTPDKKHLLQGPVTVFDDGRYAGDARLDDVPPGQTRLLSYGIDLQMSVNTRDVDERQSWIQTAKLVRGVLQVIGDDFTEKEYSAENKSGHDKTLIIEYPVRPVWKLTDTPAPIETTNAVYRFQRSVGAGKTEKFTVTETRPRIQIVALVSSGTDELLSYSHTMEIPAPVQAALAKAVALKQAVTDSQRQISEREEQIKTLDTDQNRIRENLKTVGKTGDFATRQLKKLDDQETQIDRLRGEIDALRTKLDGQQHALSEYLNGLNVG